MQQFEKIVLGYQLSNAGENVVDNYGMEKLGFCCWDKLQKLDLTQKKSNSQLYFRLHPDRHLWVRKYTIL